MSTNLFLNAHRIVFKVAKPAKGFDPAYIPDSDIFDGIRNFLQAITNRDFDDVLREKTFKLIDSGCTNTTAWGKLQFGVWGDKAKLINRSNPRDSFNQLPSHTRYTDVYFRIHSPSDGGSFFIFFTKFGNDSAYGMFLAKLHEFLSIKDVLSFTSTPVTTTAIFKDFFEKDRCRKITFTKYIDYSTTNPANIENARQRKDKITTLDFSANLNQEIVLAPKDRSFFTGVAKLFARKDFHPEMFGIVGFGPDDDVEACIDLANSNGQVKRFLHGKAEFNGSMLLEKALNSEGDIINEVVDEECIVYYRALMEAADGK